MLEGITITHPERVISDTGHVTKGELAEYHAAVAPYMLPRLLRHPLSLLRCPSGIGNQCFYQRNPGKGLGADVKPFKFKHKGKNYEYLYIEDVKGLIEIIQMGAIEIHPWGASVDDIDHPDRLIFDLDPAPDVPFEAVKLAAQDLRKRLKRKGLESMLKCTGGKGLHVTVPLAEKDDWESVKAFAAALAHEMVAAVPSAYVATMTKAKRNGKIFIDFFRNDYTATAIADYAVRARPGAPVALPLSWKELDDLESGSQFTMKDVLARLKRKKPPAVPGRSGLPAYEGLANRRRACRSGRTRIDASQPSAMPRLRTGWRALRNSCPRRKKIPTRSKPISGPRRSSAPCRKAFRNSSRTTPISPNTRDRRRHCIGDPGDRSDRQLRKLETLRSQATPGLASINDYPRLDPKRVMRIYKKLGISSVEELRAKLESGEIEQVLGSRMAQHVRQGLTETHAMLLYRADDLKSPSRNSFWVPAA